MTGPIGVEVLNEYIRKWPLETAATEAFAKTTASRERGTRTMGSGQPQPEGRKP